MKLGGGEVMLTGFVWMCSVISEDMEAGKQGQEALLSHRTPSLLRP